MKQKKIYELIINSGIDANDVVNQLEQTKVQLLDQFDAIGKSHEASNQLELTSACTLVNNILKNGRTLEEALSKIPMISNTILCDPEMVMLQAEIYVCDCLLNHENFLLKALQ